MTLPCLLILALLSADPSGSDSMDSMSRGEAAMQRLTALQPAEQREWLLKLEKRLNRANQLNLKAEDAEQERFRTAALFKQKHITAEFLQSLIDQTDEREYDAICRMAREYRKQVLAAFDGQKDKIAEYQNAGEKVYESWQLAGEPFEQQELILDWLEKAIRSTASKNPGPLPPSPKFSSAMKATSAKTIEKKPDPVLPSPETPAKPTTPAIAPRNNPPIKKSADVSAVHVNHGELSARIAGLNMNLRALETELDERKNWDVAQLTAKIAKTKTIVQQRKDLQIVRDLLSDAEQKYIEKLRSPRAVIAQLGHHIAILRMKLTEINAAEPSKAHADDLDALDQLSKELAGLAAE
jgi:hypothetical protein